MTNAENGSMKKKMLLAALLALGMLLFAGCLSQVNGNDKFNDSNNPTVYKYSRYVLNKTIDPSIDPLAPCTAMMCSKEQASETSFFKKLFGGGVLEFTLNNSNCQFIRTNTTQYADIINTSISSKSGGVNCNLTNPLTGKLEEKLCSPRYFMLGQGSNAPDYARAQMYCSGQLKMPVSWAIPNSTTGKLDKNVSPTRLACYLERDQMPVVVWYSQGKWMNTEEYKKLAASFNKPSDTPSITGPVMLTTEAFLDPTMPDSANANNPRILNFNALDATASQLRMIKQNCPKCLSVLALKPVFNSSGMPDICALDYLLNNNATRARPDECKAEYNGQQGLYDSRTDLWKFTDLVGVGFVANEENDLPSCSLEGDIGRYLSYSRATLRQFYKPGVWYAVGMATGPTATPECSITDSDLSNAYDALIGYVPAFVSSGIVGMAPYRFSDDPTGLPLKMSVEQPLFRDNTQSSLDAIRNFKSSSPPLVLVSSIDPTQALGVTRYIADQSDSERAVFLASDGSVYAARMGVTGGVNVSALASRYGFFGTDGNPHGSSAYTWFSSCEYYTSNRAQLFVATSDMNGVVQNAVLSSADGNFSVEVGGIESFDPNETLFYGTDGRAYAARPDGPEIKIYDRPITQQAPVQPIIYSANGVGSQCSAFETAKMYSRIAVRSNDAGMPYPLTISRNTEERKRTSALTCGAGQCLASVPMPKSFCYRKSASPFNEKYCMVYPQIDDAVGAQDFDALYMRAMFQQESGGAFNRCAMSKDEGNVGACGGRKDCSDIEKAASLTLGMDDPIASNTCTPSDTRSRCETIQANKVNAVCALGFAQCIEAPFSTGGVAAFCAASGNSYNPFDPFQSACCGTRKVVVPLHGTDGTSGYVAQIQRKQGSDPAWRAAIQPGEEEWYGAWLAMTDYRGNGPTMSDLDNAIHAPQTELVNAGGLVAYIDKKYAGSGVQYYGTNVIVRYNDALNKCGAICPYQDCS